MRKAVTLLGLCFLGSIVDSQAHGLMQTPPSRNWICGKETTPSEVQYAGTAKTPACSTAFKYGADPQAPYSYMAVVTHTWGREKVTPLPKHVCGFDGESWKGAQTPWDAPMAWPTNQTTAGPLTITWDVSTGPHFDDTKEFRYWITKSDFVFSPTRELTWDDFETKAFCVLEYDDKNASANPNITADKAKAIFKTTCNIPQRNGHHVIYGEWGRTEPTIERFHGCIDIAMGATGVAPKSKPAKAAARGLWLNAPQGETDLLGRTLKPGAVPAQSKEPARTPSR